MAKYAREQREAKAKAEAEAKAAEEAKAAALQKQDPAWKGDFCNRSYSLEELTRLSYAYEDIMLELYKDNKKQKQAKADAIEGESSQEA